MYELSDNESRAVKISGKNPNNTKAITTAIPISNIAIEILKIFLIFTFLELKSNNVNIHQYISFVNIAYIRPKEKIIQKIKKSFFVKRTPMHDITIKI